MDMFSYLSVECVRLTPSVSLVSTEPSASSSISLWMLWIASKLSIMFSSSHSSWSITHRSMQRDTVYHTHIYAERQSITHRSMQRHSLLHTDLWRETQSITHTHTHTVCNTCMQKDTINYNSTQRDTVTHICEKKANYVTIILTKYSLFKCLSNIFVSQSHLYVRLPVLYGSIT